MSYAVNIYLKTVGNRARRSLELEESRGILLTAKHSRDLISLSTVLVDRGREKGEGVGRGGRSALKRRGVQSETLKTESTSQRR